MTTELFGLATSIFSIGGLIGSFYVGTIADKIGRKKTSIIHCICYILGSVLNTTANTRGQLFFGRFVCGIAAGSALVITALMINELSPTETKGLLGSMNQVSINVGILFTQVLALRWCNNNDWRYLLLTAALLGGLNLVLIIAYVDESPMWLVNNGRSHDAFAVLHKLRGGEYSASRNEVNSWKQQDEEENANSREESVGLIDPASELPSALPQTSSKLANSVTLTQYLTLAEYRNSLTVGTGILVFQQFDGINSIIFYGVSVLVGIFPNYAILINCLISLVNVVVTFISAQYVDKLGRKPLLLTSVTMLGIATVLMAIGIMTTSAIISIVGTFTYIIFFAIGLGPIPFLLVGEVTQPKAKASAQSWGTAMNWLATFLVGYLFPIARAAMGGSVYFIFAIMCGISFVFIKTKIPETKGKSTYNEVWLQ
jgi:MFS family permease